MDDGPYRNLCRRRARGRVCLLYTSPGHSHKVTIPGHEHKITPGIFEYGNPQNFSLYVNGEKKADFAGRNAELDITAFLVGSDNMIPRGSWLSLEVRPDDLAYISIDLIVQGFIQSRGCLLYTS